jgi:hypothetical protein
MLKMADPLPRLWHASALCVESAWHTRRRHYAAVLAGNSEGGSNRCLGEEHGRPGVLVMNCCTSGDGVSWPAGTAGQRAELRAHVADGDVPQDDILSSDAARDDFLGLFEGTGVGIRTSSASWNSMAVNIEHEDVSLGRIEGLDVASRVRQIEQAQQAGGILMTVAVAHQASSSTRTIALHEAALEAKLRGTDLAVLHVVESLDLDIEDAYRHSVQDEVECDGCPVAASSGHCAAGRGGDNPRPDREG